LSDGILKQSTTGSDFIFGKKITYVDLSLFQMIEGLRYTFPKTMAQLEPQHPRMVTLHDRVLASPRIYHYDGGWRSTSKAFSATIPSWKRDKRKKG
jgi:glutathione S-transferase